MSSLNVDTCKQREVLRLLAHCDKELRPKAEHSNKHINKHLTYKNVQFGGTYEEIRKRFEDTLAQLDAKPRANKRIDRTCLLAIEGVLPEADETKDTEQQRDAWIAGIEKILRAKHPETVFVAEYIHYDEIHDYINPETGEHVMSRPHMHMYVMPVIDGKLNGKKFFPGRASLREFHRKVDELTKEIYGFSYGNGTKKKSFDTVEHLKLESEKAEMKERRAALAEMEKDLINRQVALHQQEKIVEDREQQVNRREAKMMAFMKSDVGRSAMQEFEASMRRSTVTPTRGKKQGGKISFVKEQEMEVK